MKAWEHYGIDPDEWWGTAYESAIEAGLDPDAAAAEARASTERMKETDLILYDWTRSPEE